MCRCTRRISLTEEDKIRRETIMRTMCDSRWTSQPWSHNLGINFEQHFEKELAALAPFEADGLVKRHATGVEVTDAGRLFIRNIAMCFDNTSRPQVSGGIRRRFENKINPAKI